MSTNIRIYPYGFSNSAMELVNKLDALIIRRERSRYVYNRNHLVINWGSASRPQVLQDVPVLNPPEKVLDATSKLKTYEILTQAGIPTLEATRSNIIANDWIQRSKVVGRDFDRASQGRGCHVYQKNSRVDHHAFYTKYFKKEREFRFHVFRDQVIFVQEKLKKRGEDEHFNRYIRSHGMGWCFGFKHLEANPAPQNLSALAVSSCASLGLNFGGVDIGWNSRNGGCIFEVNTAPGIEGTSLEAYVNSFRNLNHVS